VTDFDTWWMSLPPRERVELPANYLDDPMRGIRRVYTLAVNNAAPDAKRWLRQCGPQFDHLPILDGGGYIDPDALDEAIDAAIAAQAK